MELVVRLEFHFVLRASSHQSFFYFLVCDPSVTAGIAEGDTEDERASSESDPDGDPNDGHSVPTHDVSKQSVALFLHANLPGSSTVLRVEIVQESVVVGVDKGNCHRGGAECWLLFVNTSEEVITGGKFEASHCSVRGGDSTVLINILLDYVQVQSHRLLQSLFNLLTSRVLKVLEIVFRDALEGVAAGSVGVCA